MESSIPSKVSRTRWQVVQVSPLLMNMYLHHHVDRHYEKRAGQQKLIRYADYFVVMCQSQKEVQAGLKILDDLLTKAGLQVKPESEPIAKLNKDDVAEMLGFRISSHHGRITWRSPKNRWNDS